jgi:hypothetical protein
VASTGAKRLLLIPAAHVVSAALEREHTFKSHGWCGVAACYAANALVSMWRALTEVVPMIRSLPGPWSVLEISWA